MLIHDFYVFFTFFYGPKPDVYTNRCCSFWSSSAEKGALPVSRLLSLLSNMQRQNPKIQKLDDHH